MLHDHYHHDDDVELQGSVCGSIATAATRPSALPAQTLNTESMALSGNNEDSEDQDEDEDNEDQDENEDNEDENGENEDENGDNANDGENEDKGEDEVSKPCHKHTLISLQLPVSH